MAIDTIFNVKGTIKGYPEFTAPAAQFKIADMSVGTTQVGAGGQGDCGSAMQWFRAFIYQKGAVPSTIAIVSGQSSNLVYQLEVSSVVGFTSGTTRTGASAIMDRASSSRGTIVLGPCLMADAANASGYQFVRVTAKWPTGDSTSWDTIIEAC